jgi:probable blue pigment (indigoidine) exporter
MNRKLLWIFVGSFFAMLWPSASTATKIGLNAAQPLVIAVVRFGIAAFIMLFITHVIGKHRLPKGKEWTQVTIYGLLNITIYLGCYVIAMQTITAGIGSLATATNPVFIAFLSTVILKEKLSVPVILAIIICAAGVVVAALPLFEEAEVTTNGLLILLFSMLSYSVAAIYFSSQKWNDLHLLAINGWQTLIGGIFLLPISLFFYKSELNHYNFTFWSAVLWLAIPVSIFAMQLWLWLLRSNPVKAGLWLFLCPLFGFVFAAWLVGDKISMYTVIGMLLVLGGLFISQFRSVVSK